MSVPGVQLFISVAKALTCTSTPQIQLEAVYPAAAVLSDGHSTNTQRIYEERSIRRRHLDLWRSSIAMVFTLYRKESDSCVIYATIQPHL